MNKGRFDKRTRDVFARDILFSTNLEKYFFDQWVDRCKKRNIIISNIRDNGVDNTGQFIENGKTSGADYMIDLSYNQRQCTDMPIEVKWVPTFGKLTLKVGDLKAYLRESAAILFIYTSKSFKNLRKPQDYDLTKHIALIESIDDFIMWGLMMPEKIEQFLKTSQEMNLIRPINYMGGKPGIVLQQLDFSNWFIEERWNLE